MILKTITVNNNRYPISLVSVWKKMNWENKYTVIEGTNMQWKVSKKFTELMHICSLCRGVIWVMLFAISIYLIIETEFLFEGNPNLISVLFNLILIAFPILLFEWLILMYAPVETEEKRDII